MSDGALIFVDRHRPRFLAELKEFLAIPSISTLADHSGAVRAAATWLADHLARVGLSSVRVMETGGHPVVYGEWLGAEDAETVLVYGHYDVQPPDPLSEWDSPPFTPCERDGYLYGRGASDDKGQVFAQVKALEALLATEGRLPVNVKVLIEGEEEIASRNLAAFVRANRELLAANSVAICDGPMLGPEQPSITYALRGTVALQIDVQGPAHDLHSGLYGGSVHNPAHALSRILVGLYKADGSVAVPGFYDRVRPLDATEAADLARIPYSTEAWQNETGAPKPWGEAGFSLIERITARPALEINGLFGGYQGTGRKMIIPAHAGAKLSARLVLDQDVDEIADLITRHILDLAPDTVHVEVTNMGGVPPVYVPRTLPQMQAAIRAYEAVFRQPPIFTREGSSIGAVSIFQQVLGAPSILLNLGLRDDGYHRPNERFRIDLFDKGIRTLIYYFRGLGGQGRIRT